MSDTPSGGYGGGGGGGGDSFADPMLLQLQQMSLASRILTTVNPWMKERPDVLMELVGSGAPPDQLAMSGAGMYAMQSFDAMRETLNKMSPVAQRSVYGRLTAEQQRSLNQMGYAPPVEEPGQFAQTMAEVGDKVGMVAGPVWAPISTVGGPVLKAGLDIVTWIGDRPAHLYRAIRQMDDWQQWVALGAGVAAAAAAPFTLGGSLYAYGGILGTTGLIGLTGTAGILGASAAAAATDPFEWYEAMDATYDGEKVFERDAQRRARELLRGGELVSLAKNLAISIDPEELAMDIVSERGGGSQASIISAVEETAATIADPGSPQYQQIFGGLMALVQEEPFRQAVDILQRGKISFGRDLADVMGFDQNSAMHGLVSGMLDGVWLVSMDPTMVAGKLSHLNRIRRLGAGVAGGDDFVARIAGMAKEGGPLHQPFSDFAQAVGTGRWSQVPKRMQGLVEPFKEYLRQQGGIPIRGKTFQGYVDHLSSLDELASSHIDADVVRYAIQSDKIAEAARVSDEAVEVADDLRDIDVVGHMIDGIEYSTDELVRLRNGFREWAPAPRPEQLEAEDVVEYFRQGDGVYRILSGKSTLRGVEHAILTARSETAGWGRFVNVLRNVRDEWDNPALEAKMKQVADEMGQLATLESKHPSNVMEQGLDVNLSGDSTRQILGGSKLGQALGQFSRIPLVGYPTRTVGSLINSITRMAPAGKAVILEGPGSERDIPRFVEMMGRASNMPSWMRDRWLDDIMVKGSAAERLEVLSSFQDTAFAAAGLRSNDDLIKLADRYLGKYKHAFALGGIDYSNTKTAVMGGLPVVTGVLPSSHQAVMLVMPDLKEMTKAVRRGNIAKHLAKVSDHDFVEATMSRFWKPAVLLRLGFIPRAAGEEALAWMARMTTGGVLQEFGARHVAMRERYIEVAGKKAALKAGEKLSSEEKLILSWRIPAHLKPLHWMMTRKGFKNPQDAFAERWLTGVERFFDRGIGPRFDIAEGTITQGPVLRVPIPFIGTKSIRTNRSSQWHHGLIYGRTGSWRRLALQGVDPTIREAAGSWVRMHSRAVMAEASAQNASQFEKALHAPETQLVNVVDPATGESKSIPLMVTMGERERIYEDNPLLQTAFHHRLMEMFDDEILGPVLEDVFSHYFAVNQFDDLTPQILHDHVAALQGLNFDTRRLYLEALEPRQDNWDSLAGLLRQSDSEADRAIARLLDDELVRGEVSWANLIAGAKKMAADPDVSPDVAIAMRGLGEQMGRLTPTVDLIPDLNANSRKWLSGVLTGEASDAMPFNLPALKGWADGSTDFVHEQPATIFERGVSSDEPFEIRPNADGTFDLVLFPQTQRHWGATRTAVSLTVSPKESLAYASRIPFPDQTQSDIGIGAVFQIDGEYMLHEGATTMDELAANPTTYARAAGEPERVGLQLIGESHDVVPEEIAQVFFRQEHVDEGPAQLDAMRANFPGYSDANLESMAWEVRPLGIMVRGAASDSESWDEYVARVIDLVENVEDPTFIAPVTMKLYAQLKADPDPVRIQAWADDLVAQIWPAAVPGQAGGRQEVVVPWGKWAVKSTGDMEMSELFESANDANGKWGWITNLQWSDDTGKPIEQLVDEAHQALRTAKGQKDLHAGVDSLSAYFDSLTQGQRDMMSQVLGVDLMEPYQPGMLPENLSRRAAFDIFNLDEDPNELTQIRKMIELRGQGGFGQNVPRWSPFATTPEQVNKRAVESIFAALADPRNAESVRRSRYTQITNDGERVAGPMQEGVQRVHVPQISGDYLDQAMAYAVAQSPSSQGELVDTVVAKLLAQPNVLRTESDYVQRLTAASRYGALRAAVEARIKSAGRGGKWSRPVQNVGYSDPRLTSWVSDVISGTDVVRPPGGQYYVDIPPSGVSDETPLLFDTSDAGVGYRLSNTQMAQVSHVTAGGTVMIDGQAVAGKSYQAALHEWAELIWRHVRTQAGSGTVETMVIREGAEVSRNIGGRLVPVPAGSRFNHKVELFTADGKPIDWASPRYMQPEVSTSDDFLFAAFMPMIRDRFEQAGAFAKYPKHRVGESEGVFDLSNQVADDDQWIHMTRSRVDDITDAGTAGILPNVALSEVYHAQQKGTPWDRLVRWGFDNVIGPSLDGLVRTPMAFHYYVAAHRQNMTFRTGWLDQNLVKIEVPRVFADDLAAVEVGTRLTPAQADAARVLARDVYELPVEGMEDTDAARWVANLGNTHEEYYTQLLRDQDKAHRYGQLEARAAVDELLTVDDEAIRLLDTAGKVDSAEQLIAAYYRSIPDEYWRRGQQAVNTYIRSQGLGLRQLARDEEWKLMSAARRNYANITERLEEAAAQRAIENVVPFLDSHEERSQFAVVARNFLPFWYAEENFLKRWARTMAIDGTMGLATIRKAQLAYMGLRSAGIVRTDTNGRDWFVYPGSGLLAEAVQKIPFVPDTLPTGVMFQASVESMLPGVNAKFGTPSVAPWVAMPMDGVTMLFPDAVPLRNALLGEVAANQGRPSPKSAMQHFVPTTLRRTWEAFFGDENSSDRYASALNSALAYMEANGQGLPDTATADEIDTYLDRARNHARIILFSQAVGGFIVPGAPVAVTTGEDLSSFKWWTGLGVDNPAELISDRYRSYVNNYGINDGTMEFLADFPESDLPEAMNPLAFTVSQSVSASGAPLPATRTALTWYEDNQGWVDSMPDAGTWYLPPDDEDDEDFDYYSYSQQLVNDLRKKRSPEDFLRALKYRQGAATYFDVQDSYEQAKATEGVDENTGRKLDEFWDQWSTTWLGTHPIFAEELVSGEARARRQRTIDQLRYASTDPQAPPSPHSAAISEMAEVYDVYRTSMMMLQEHRDQDSQAKVTKLRHFFEDWATAWTMRNPEMERLWSAVYRPESFL